METKSTVASIVDERFRKRRPTKRRARSTADLGATLAVYAGPGHEKGKGSKTKATAQPLLERPENGPTVHLLARFAAEKEKLLRESNGSLLNAFEQRGTHAWGLLAAPQAQAKKRGHTQGYMDEAATTNRCIFSQHVSASQVQAIQHTEHQVAKSSSTHELKELQQAHFANAMMREERSFLERQAHAQAQAHVDAQLKQVQCCSNYSTILACTDQTHRVLCQLTHVVREQERDTRGRESTMSQLEVRRNLCFFVPSNSVGTERQQATAHSSAGYGARDRHT
jgi:hypothetical protein